MSLSLRPGVTLYFCRHGETEANVEKRFQGLATNTPLTSKGLMQAESLAHLLARATPDFASLAFVSSPLKRACLTMEIVLDTLGLQRDSYRTDSRLAEINLGAWDGLTDEEARALDPEMFEERGNDKWNVRVPGGGENYADVAARAESWIADLVADTLAVSHGAFTRILRGLFAGMTWEQMSNLDEMQGVLFSVSGNTVTRLETPESGARERNSGNSHVP